MTFDRSKFPPLTEEEEQLILNHEFVKAVKEYRARSGSFIRDRCTCIDRESCTGIDHYSYTSYNMGLLDAKRVIEFERDRLFQDRTLTPAKIAHLSYNVRNMLSSLVDTLANQECVTRAHVWDLIVHEASRAPRS